MLKRNENAKLKKISGYIIVHLASSKNYDEFVN